MVSEESEDVRVACPYCGGHIQFPETALGEIIRCPHCGKETTLANERASMPAARTPAEKQTRRVPRVPTRLIIAALIAIAFALAIFLFIQWERPEARFERHVVRLRATLPTILVRPLSYDVRKTDSLVTPFVGEIEYATKSATSESMGFLTHLILAFQAGHWRLVKVEGCVIWDGGSPDHKVMVDSSAIMIHQTSRALGLDDVPPAPRP